MKKLVLAGVAAVAVGASSLPAQALPGTAPDNTFMTNGVVRDIERVGPNVWIAGQFTQLLDRRGQNPISVRNLVVLDAATGGPAAGISPPRVAGGTAPIVYDLSFDGTTLWLAGKFMTVGGLPRRNLAGITRSGGVTSFSVSSPPLKSVFGSGSRVFGGGRTLISFNLTGDRTPGFSPPTASTDPDLRGHVTRPAFRDIEQVGSELIVACQCDSITDSNGTHATKAAAKISATSGALLDWSPEGLGPQSTAFGISVVVMGPRVLFGMGGSDFIAAYRLATGAKRWHTDVNGSAHVIEAFDAGTLVAGGHWTYVADEDTRQCPSRHEPPGGCFAQPRMAAFNITTGSVIKAWKPKVCCLLNGVWALNVNGAAIHVGGEFTKVGGVPQQFYARLS